MIRSGREGVGGSQGLRAYACDPSGFLVTVTKHQLAATRTANGQDTRLVNRQLETETTDW